MKVEIHGVQVFLKQVNNYHEELIKKSMAGLIKCQNTLIKEAMQITPWKTGNLARSYSAPIPTVTGNQVVATVENSAEYAVRVHEMPDPRLARSDRGQLIPKPVNWSKEGTGNKFLERPLFANANKFLEYIRRGK